MPPPPPCRSARKEYIVAKYMERRYVQRGGRDEPHRLWDAIRTRDLLALLQAFAEGHDLAKPLVTPEGQVSPPGAPPREGFAQPGGCFGVPGLSGAVPSCRQDAGELALHVAVRYADRSSLPLVDFIIQNGYGQLGSCHLWCPGDVPEVLGCPHEDGEQCLHSLELSLLRTGGHWTGRRRTGTRLCTTARSTTSPTASSCS